MRALLAIVLLVGCTPERKPPTADRRPAIAARRTAPVLVVHDDQDWDDGGFRISAPYIEDASARAAFKAWWVDELLRRMTAARRDEYPDAAWTRARLEQLYDAAEVNGPGEGESCIRARVAAGMEIMAELTAAYGDSPSSLANLPLAEDLAAELPSTPAPQHPFAPPPRPPAHIAARLSPSPIPVH